MMDVERAQELKTSLMWSNVVEELDKKIFHLGQRLHSCAVDELKNLQAEIRACQALKNLPDEIIDREAGPQEP